MNTSDARARVRDCLLAVNPALDLDALADDTPLLASRVITSFDVVALLLHLEQASGRPLSRGQLVAGSFRDVATIARVFLQDGDGS